MNFRCLSKNEMHGLSTPTTLQRNPRQMVLIHPIRGPLFIFYFPLA